MTGRRPDLLPQKTIHSVQVRISLTEKQMIILRKRQRNPSARTTARRKSLPDSFLSRPKSTQVLILIQSRSRNPRTKPIHPETGKNSRGRERNQGVKERRSSSS